MAQIVIASLKRTKRQDNKSRSVRRKRLRKSNGEFAWVHALDANDDNFIDDLTTVFEKNVAKARRENKQLFGSPDGGQVATKK